MDISNELKVIDARLKDEIESINVRYEQLRMMDSPDRLYEIKRAQAKANDERKLLVWQSGRINTTQSNTDDFYKDLLKLIPQDDKRLKEAIKMAYLLVTKEIASDFQLAKCLIPALRKKDYSKDKFFSKIRSRIITLNKYWKVKNVKIKRASMPIKGYQLVRISSKK